MIRHIALGAALLAPTPCLASYDLTCTGRGDTPRVELTLGSSDYDSVTAFSLHRGKRTLAAGLGGGLRLVNAGKPDLLIAQLVNPKGTVMAQVRLESRGDGPLKGVLLYNGRRYWVTCGALG